MGLAGTFRHCRKLPYVPRCACQPHPKHRQYSLNMRDGTPFGREGGHRLRNVRELATVTMPMPTLTAKGRTRTHVQRRPRPPRNGLLLRRLPLFLNCPCLPDFWARLGVVRLCSRASSLRSWRLTDSSRASNRRPLSWWWMRLPPRRSSRSSSRRARRRSMRFLPLLRFWRDFL